MRQATSSDFTRIPWMLLEEEFAAFFSCKNLSLADIKQTVVA
jgi:hypothetical protein